LLHSAWISLKLQIAVYMHLGHSFGDLCVQTEKPLILHCVDLQHRKKNKDLGCSPAVSTCISFSFYVFGIYLICFHNTVMIFLIDNED
jgi:hypothetical protein